MKDPRCTLIITGPRGTVLGTWGVDTSQTLDDQGNIVGYDVTDPNHIDQLAEEIQIAIETALTPPTLPATMPWGPAHHQGEPPHGPEQNDR
jgi:hypothetical protein